MGMYKAHKNDFRWITNAHNCAFSSITDFNTNLLKALNEGLVEVSDTLHKKIHMFTKINANAYWIIQNQYEFLINLPHHINNVHLLLILNLAMKIYHIWGIIALWILYKRLFLLLKL